MRKPKIGLSLGGGGAKGAYGFGWLKAFHEHRIRIDVLSGTSVGGLSSLLWSLGRIEDGERFWREISVERIYPFRIWAPVAGIYVLLRAQIHRLSEKARGRDQGLTLMSSVPYGFFLSGLMAIVIVFGWATSTPIDYNPWFPLFAGFLPWILLYWLPARFIKNNYAVFSSGPLSATVRRFLSGFRIGTPVYVTSAFRAKVAHPDALLRMSAEFTDSTSCFPAEMWIPAYTRLDGDTPEQEVVEAMLTTAALPYGIVPHVGGFVDGGLADNLPVWPLLAKEDCDIIVCISLDYNNPLSAVFSELLAPQYTESGVLEYAVRIDEMLRSADGDVCRIIGEDHSRLPEYYRMESPTFMNRKTIIHAIRPTKDLGGFLDGTMNFNAKYCSSLLDNGYGDACSWLKANRSSLD